MKSTNHDLKIVNIEKALAEFAHGQMHDEHTVALIYRLKQRRPEGFASRNRRRRFHNPGDELT